MSMVTIGWRLSVFGFGLAVCADGVLLREKP